MEGELLEAADHVVALGRHQLGVFGVGVVGDGFPPFIRGCSGGYLVRVFAVWFNPGEFIFGEFDGGGAVSLPLFSILLFSSLLW
jgi:hypothetical protein